MLWGFNQVSDFQKLVVEGYASHVLGMNEYAFSVISRFTRLLSVQA